MTNRFFLKGEEQELNEYKDAVLEEAPAQEFKSFDKIPRRRSALLASVALVSLLAAGAAWKFRGLAGELSYMKAAAIAIVSRRPPAPEPVLAPAPPAPRAAASVPAIPAVAEPASPAVVEPVPEPVAATEPVAAKEPEATVEDAEPKAFARKDSSNALRGYVWSPAAGALVPAESAARGEELAVSPVEPPVVPERYRAADPDDTLPPSPSALSPAVSGANGSPIVE